MNVYLLLDIDYDNTTVLGAFWSSADVLAAQAVEGGTVEVVEVEDVTTFVARHVAQRAEDERERSERAERDLARKESERLNHLAWLNGQPHSYPRPYAAPHKLTEVQLAREWNRRPVF